MRMEWMHTDRHSVLERDREWSGGPINRWSFQRLPVYSVFLPAQPNPVERRPPKTRCDPPSFLWISLCLSPDCSFSPHKTLTLHNISDTMCPWMALLCHSPNQIDGKQSISWQTQHPLSLSLGRHFQKKNSFCSHHHLSTTVTRCHSYTITALTYVN